MLITRMTPKMTARPSEMMSRIATMLKPVRNCVKSACAMDPRLYPYAKERAGGTGPGPSARATRDHQRDLETAQLLLLTVMVPDFEPFGTCVKSQSLSG